LVLRKYVPAIVVVVKPTALESVQEPLLSFYKQREWKFAAIGAPSANLYGGWSATAV
jgi:hypothetical protein